MTGTWHGSLLVRVLVGLGCLALLPSLGCSDGGGGGSRDVVVVPDDAPTIGAAMDLVAEDGLVLVEPGRYTEQVTITRPGVTLRGADRNEVVIDAEGTRSAAVVATADGVRIENLTVANATLYGLLITKRYDDGTDGSGYDTGDPEEQAPLERFRVDHVTAVNNGLYGIYAFSTRHGVIVDSLASGSADSGFYVGQCRGCDVLVTGNIAVNNAVGFENANASDSVTVVGNRFSDNRVGLTLTSNHLEAFVPQKANVVVGNVISGNTSADSPAQADGGFGIGIGIAGGQDNEVAANRVEGNPRAGVLLTNAEDLPATGNRFRDNAFGGNGVDVANVSTARAPASGNCLVGPVTSVRPPGLFDACERANPAAAPGDLPVVEAPAGVSFLDVPLPPPQPSREADRTVPPRLPSTIEHPDPASVATPPADLLADLLS